MVIYFCIAVCFWIYGLSIEYVTNSVDTAKSVYMFLRSFLWPFMLVNIIVGSIVAIIELFKNKLEN